MEQVVETNIIPVDAFKSYDLDLQCRNSLILVVVRVDKRNNLRSQGKVWWLKPPVSVMIAESVAFE